MSAERRPRTLPIRRWLGIALVTALFLPVLVGVVVQSALRDDRIEPRLSETLRENVEQWEDPAWRESIDEQFRGEAAEFALYRNGEELYRSALDLPESDGLFRWIVGHEVIVVGENEYVAYVYFEESVYPLGFLIALATFALAAIGLVWFLTRMVVRPLQATSDATRDVSAGDLDVHLPPSRVREVAEVNEAFVRMSSDLRASLEDRSRLEQDRRFFISAIAHDLRTPLFSLRGYLEGLQQGVADTPEKRAEYLAVAHEKANVLERMITELSEFTRLEYLDQTPNREPLDFGELLRYLVDGLQPRAKTKGVLLELVDSSTPHIVNGDSHLLTRVIENLLDNALRHTPPGGSITVQCREEPGQVQFAVSDTGPGIPEADLPHIFAPLYRGESSRSRRTGGAGLGLAIAQRIMQAHDGTLAAANQPMGGAVFTGALPGEVLSGSL